MFQLNFPLSGLRPAAYNPRSIDGGAFTALRESVRRLGVVRPIIVTNDGRLIAGHQRSKAIEAEGFTTAPAQVLVDVGKDDEIRFNQLHNASDKEIVDASLKVKIKRRARWQLIDPGAIDVVRRPERFAAKLNEVLRLLAKHGEWGNAVVTKRGDVVAGQLYAYACFVLKIPLRVCVVDGRQAEEVADRLGRAYGAFSYGHLPKTTWVQSLAQMYRIRAGREARGRSRTYESQVIPRLNRSMRVLDFGAGQMDYVRHLRRRGYKIQGVEFYYRRAGELALDLPAIHQQVDQLCDSLREHGLFDMVVCDSVLNSVDSEQAQRDVLTSVNALCRPGGTIIFSGRCREFADSTENRLRFSSSANKKNVYFIDDAGFSAMYQRGVWLFQRFHRRDQAESLGATFVGRDVAYRRRSSGWSVAGTKSRSVAGSGPALAREFNLPLPDGTTLGRSNDIQSAIEAAQSRARTAQCALFSAPTSN